MPVTVYCVTCGRGTTITAIGELPDCYICGSTTWRSADQPNDQQYPYRLTHNDKGFLRSIRVEPSE